MVFVLDQTFSIANEFLIQLRDQKIQVDRMRFRQNLERLGTLLAYELSKSFAFQEHQVKTSLGIAHTHTLSSQPVLIPILRAALPFYQGFLHVFDAADSGFIGAYRTESTGVEQLTIDMEYMACGNIEGRTVVLIDPMLATGKSIVQSAEALRAYGTPEHLHFVAAIAAPEGIAYIQDKISGDYSNWTGAIDEKLNDKSYIIPGLGDAGDLCFGEKV